MFEHVSEVVQATTPSIFAGVRWDSLLLSAVVGSTVSLLTTLSARSRQRLRGLPLTSFLLVIPDTLLATLMGMLATLVGTAVYHPLNNFTGVLLLSGGGGLLGPQIWQWLSVNGLDLLLDWAQSWASGAGQKLTTLQRRREEDHDASSTQHDADPPK